MNFSTDSSSEGQKKIQSIPGMHDILPDDHDYLTFIKKVIRHRCRQNGIRRITTPVLEYTELFQRSIGDETDIVQKEMYTFHDQSDNMLTMRPEMTAGVVRSYIEHGMYNLPQPVDLYYIEPMFRRERPQKGRYRQFNQFGVEMIGENDPALDAELISLCYTIFQDVGLGKNIEVIINSIGCPHCRPKYIHELQNFYAGKERNLCEKCQERAEKNALRLLDCKEEDCQILSSMAPKMKDYLCADCAPFHAKLKEYLKELNIPFMESEKLVRGLDYYTKTVFEFVLKNDDRSQNALGGGGRYDKLAELLGGPDTPGLGFACGMERIVMAMKEAGLSVPSKDVIHVFLIQLGDEAKKRSLALMKQLRDAGIKIHASFGKDSIKSQLRLADRLQAPYALILGQVEVKEGVVILRDMEKGKQKKIKLEDIERELIEIIGEKNLDMHDFKEELKKN